MKKRSFSQLFQVSALGLLAFLAACTPKHYAPNQLNIPGFREKGEIKAAASHCNGDDYTGFDAQAAWAPIKHVSVSGDFMYGAASRNKKPGGWGQGHHANLALGTFWKVGGRGSLEAGYGFGLGKVENWSRVNDGDFIRSYQFRRGFGQISYTARLRNFELGIGSRFVGLQHYDRKDDDVLIGGLIGWNYLWEPGAILAMGGGKRFKLTVSFSRSISFQEPEERILFTQNFNLGIGAHYRLGKLANFKEAEKREKAAFEAKMEEKTQEVEQKKPRTAISKPETEVKKVESIMPRNDASVDSARVLLKRYLKTGGMTDAPENVEKMRKTLAAIDAQPARTDVSILIDVWLLYRPEGFDSKETTEEVLFKFADEAIESISRKLKTSRYTSFEISELKALRKRLNASK